jgi:hypothetical protein
VAGRAVGAEARRGVIRVAGALIVALMTGDASRRGSGKPIVGVTLGAFGRPVLAPKGKHPFVVEARALPAGRGVAVTTGAARGEARGEMVRLRVLVLASMAITHCEGVALKLPFSWQALHCACAPGRRSRGQLAVLNRGQLRGGRTVRQIPGGWDSSCARSPRWRSLVDDRLPSRWHAAFDDGGFREEKA